MYLHPQKKTFRDVTWLAVFKTIGQSFSWVSTLVLARLLAPSDYGLMTMATVMTGFGLRFSELGLGSAIIQRPYSTHKELSSVFWFSLLIGLVCAGACFFGAGLIAHLFHEPRVIPLARVAAVIFLLNGLQIVPISLLMKDLRFKTFGLREMGSVIISCCSMLCIAYLGGGVWALMGGYVILSACQLIFCFAAVKWVPVFRFSYKETREYLTFGMNVSIGRSLFYIFESSDKFIAGRVWTAMNLGLYSFALQLASIPTDKISTLINQTSFPALARLQHDKAQFNALYLQTVKLTATLVLPVFLGGFLLGDDLINVLLAEKWLPIVFVFKYLCLAQIITAINAINGFVHNAQGRPTWSLCFYASLGILMPISFYLAAPYGLRAFLVPWFTAYLFLCGAWIAITLRKLEISVLDYLRTLSKPVMGTGCMVIGILICEYWMSPSQSAHVGSILYLGMRISLGAMIYIGFLGFYDRQLIRDFKKLRKPQAEA